MTAKKTVTRPADRSPEQIESERATRARFQQNRPSLASLVESGDFTAPIKQGEYLALMEFASLIKQTREQMHLSLADVASRSGIDRSAISRLENGLVENPTVGMLMKIAKSLGKRIRIALEDETEEPVGLDQ